MARKKKDPFGTKTIEGNVGKTHDVFGHGYDDPRWYPTAGFTSNPNRRKRK